MPQSPSTASPQQFLLILRRRWRILAFVWLGVAGTSAAWTFSQTRLYRPQVTLEIRPEKALLQTADDPTLGQGGNMWENYYRTQENILTGPTLVDQTLKALPEAIRRDYESQPDPVRALTEQIDIEQVRASFVLRVGIVDRDPEKAAQIANTLVSVFLEDASRRMRDVKTETIEALSKDTLPGIRKRVAEAEKALQDFQAAGGYIDFDEQYKTLLDGWRKIKTALLDIRMRRVKLTSELDALSKYRADGTGGEFHPTFHQTAALERLVQERDRVVEALAAERLTHKEQHPSVRQLLTELDTVEKRIREAVAGALVALQTDLTATVTEEKALGEELSAVEEEMARAGTRRQDQRRLDEEVVAAKDVYASYLKRHGETSATAGTGLSSVRIIDHARPPRDPWKPKVLLNLVLGCLAGLMLGMAAMLVTDQVDDRILSPEEVEAFVGLDVLTAVPRLDGGTDDAPALLAESSTIAEFEAFRGLRAEILTRLEKNPDARVLAVLSPLQGEGKTTVTVNLAKVMALEGRRVLLIDADMRKPKLKGFMKDAGGPGLEEVLAGKATLDDAARVSVIPGVEIVGVREGTLAAAELAGSSPFDALIRAARAKYDFVIVDNAPVIQASESALIARRADGAILVVREGRTGRNVARAAVRRLKGMGVKLLGAVLNCASPQGRGYGYGYGYGYGETRKGKA